MCTLVFDVREQHALEAFHSPSWVARAVTVIFGSSGQSLNTAEGCMDSRDISSLLSSSPLCCIVSEDINTHEA